MAGISDGEVTYFRKDRPDPQREDRRLIEESPLVIDVQDAESFTVMRTPGHDRELTIGFLFAEGLIDHIDDVLTLEQCKDVANVVRVRIADPGRQTVQRNLVVNTSCGLCGRVDIAELIESLGKVDGQFSLAANVLYELPDDVMARQTLFRDTGASHAAALFDGDGHIQVLHEDLGRHNAVDKVLGHCLLHELSLADAGLFLSGRTSLELIVKAARARIGLVAAVGAASDMAVELATHIGITLCGFVRGSEIVVYSHDRRIHNSRPT